MLKTPIVFPSHAAVDWAGRRLINGVEMVSVTCPVCGNGRGCTLKSILHRVRYTIFTGRCDECGVKARKHNKPPSEFQHD